jgi:hypothetical protein
MDRRWQRALVSLAGLALLATDGRSAAWMSTLGVEWICA